ncbi:hypothetical protein GY45DRAFT_535969 [Cubamyces sp. BRFM 1775]|nr:hypothetical protein GY45DRAFT_535969 [Cubamyces sp. BRFM 1775]
MTHSLEAVEEACQCWRIPRVGRLSGIPVAQRVEEEETAAGEAAAALISSGSGGRREYEGVGERRRRLGRREEGRTGFMEDENRGRGRTGGEISSGG